MRRFVASVIALLLTACASYAPTIPEGYAGPVAEIQDSSTMHSGSKADLFYVAAVDGAPVRNSLVQTRVANQGRGFSLTPVMTAHPVQARPLRLTIIGRTEYAAPILTFTNTVYQVKGDVEFVPEPGKTYLVKGLLGAQYSTVWVQELSSGLVVGRKVEVHGSAALGFFEK